MNYAADSQLMLLISMSRDAKDMKHLPLYVRYRHLCYCNGHFYSAPRAKTLPDAIERQPVRPTMTGTERFNHEHAQNAFARG